MGSPTVGVSFTFNTLMEKSLDTCAPAVSVAVTLTTTVPTSLFPGVPLNVRVAGLKVSQLGKLLPPASVASYLKVSPASISANVFTGISKVNGAFSLIV
ncbi:hypothetical protein D3C73_1165140 [compost metagenome]